MAGLDFTAIDFETANGSRASACAVGLVRVINGEVVGSAHSLIRPAAEYSDFAPGNMRIHGITADQVSSAPSWKQLLLPILSFTEGTTLVAHNAEFDRDVFESTTAANGLEAATPDFLCTLELAQTRMQLVDYKLPTVAGSLGVTLKKHHDAAFDALACANVALKISRLFEEITLEGLWSGNAATPTPSRARRNGQGNPAYAGTISKRLSELPQASTDANPTNPLYGRTFVFTGELNSMERDEAMAAVAKHGASSGNNITKKTTHLVVGESGWGTGKETKARAYIAGGQEIHILSESEFRVLLMAATSR